MRVGGSAAITALALANLGAAVRLVGCVGDDALGALLLDQLREASVATDEVVVVGSATTGISIAFEAPSRDRSFLISLGSLADFEPSMVPVDALESPYVLLCGYFDVPRMRGDAAARMLRSVRAGGGTTLLDPGWDPAGWTAANRRELLELLPLVDLFLPNEDEACRLAEEEDVREAASVLRGRSGGWVVVKRGRDGCIAAGPGDAFLSEPARDVEVVDTTGAGDSFNGGLLLRLSEGAEMDDAVRFAVRVGSAVVARPSSDRYPSRADIE